MLTPLITDIDFVRLEARATQYKNQNMFRPAKQVWHQCENTGESPAQKVVRVLGEGWICNVTASSQHAKGKLASVKKSNDPKLWMVLAICASEITYLWSDH